MIPYFYNPIVFLNNLESIFSTPLLDWYQKHGRKNLPWQTPRTAYRVWISEIMLQQTQVQTVIPYFERFITRFPTIELLAQAQEDEVLSLWSGLGYYSRARHILQSAQLICSHYQGIFPQDMSILESLPGIGPSTAGAILAQAFNLPTAILDGNVKRVLCRFFKINGNPETAATKKQLWKLAQNCMPDYECANYTQAIMDLGATCCTNKNPNCLACPLITHCQAFKNSEQELYPFKKTKKIIPLKKQQFLVLQNQFNQIYLEKRPPTGLWGGLWCLPAVEEQDCPLDFIKIHYNLCGSTPQNLTHFKHKFSHFHLEISALLIFTQNTGQHIRESQGKWFHKNQLQCLGLAKPTTHILELVE